MMQRVVGVATLSVEPRSRAEALAQALAGRGDTVVLFRPPGGEETPGVETVTVGRGLSNPPRVREVARFAGSLAAKALGRHARRRFDTLVLQGGEEALALLGAVPRLVGARIVLDLDGEALGRTAGWAGALAGLVRAPALRLVDGAIASDEMARARLEGGDLSPAEVPELEPRPAVPRRDKQPRMTVRSALTVVTRVGHLSPERQLLVFSALSELTERHDRLSVLLEGVSEPEVEGLREMHGLPLEAAPARGQRGWADAMQEAHLSLSVDESAVEIEPLLDFGLPTVRVSSSGPGPLDAEGVVASVRPDPERLAATLLRLGRSSRERRDLVRQGWAWVDAHGYAARTERLFAIIDGPEEERRSRKLLGRGVLTRSAS
ncbi:MAG: hypothetical protein AAFZ18_32075 [Myxococcota bacterium]